MLRRNVFAAVLMICLACIGCEQEESDPIVTDPVIAGNLVSVEGCKSGFTKSAADRNIGCMKFQYDAASRKLTLTHVNAGFNCCPEEINAEVTVEKGVIRIVESERGPNCRCNCLFDLNILVENVPAGMFTVVVDEPLRNEKDIPIEFTIDLSKESEGEHCVPRNFYPWGV
ncbi:MAG: hypothetical protein IH600_16800 [Bacteroidetes bacterium]|nr:hypothetical protein [Bacteroidota bacterium]